MLYEGTQYSDATTSMLEIHHSHSPDQPTATPSGFCLPPGNSICQQCSQPKAHSWSMSDQSSHTCHSVRSSPLASRPCLQDPSRQSAPCPQSCHYHRSSLCRHRLKHNSGNVAHLKHASHTDRIGPRVYWGMPQHADIGYWTHPGGTHWVPPSPYVSSSLISYSWHMYSAQLYVPTCYCHISSLAKGRLVYTVGQWRIKSFTP